MAWPQALVHPSHIPLGLYVWGALMMLVGLASWLQPGPLTEANYRGVAVGFAGPFVILAGFVYQRVFGRSWRRPD